MSCWNSYPSIYNLGHAVLTRVGFLSAPMLVQEKVDGSQFSFGLIDGELRYRSKGTEVLAQEPEKMFRLAVDAVASRAHLLHPDWAYRAEYLSKPKHNVLKYARVPQSNLILFDINRGLEDYLPYDQVVQEGIRLDLETVPRLHEGVVNSAEELLKFLDLESVLGGTPVEGVVLKRYDLFGPDKKVLMGKYVSERFKEVHKLQWKVDNPKQGDIIQLLVDSLRSEARWQKVLQHLQERGELTGELKDIGPLMREVPADILKEEREQVMDTLFKWAWPRIQRQVTSGLPEWYKQVLLGKAFMGEGGG